MSFEEIDAKIIYGYSLTEKQAEKASKSLEKVKEGRGNPPSLVKHIYHQNFWGAVLGYCVEKYDGFGSIVLLKELPPINELEQKIIKLRPILKRFVRKNKITKKQEEPKFYLYAYIFD